VAVFREQLLKGCNWDQIAAYQTNEIFTMTDRTDEDLRRLAALYSDDLAENVLEPSADMLASASQRAAGVDEGDEYEDI